MKTVTQLKSALERLAASRSVPLDEILRRGKLLSVAGVLFSDLATRNATARVRPTFLGAESSSLHLRFLRNRKLTMGPLKMGNICQTWIMRTNSFHRLRNTTWKTTLPSFEQTESRYTVEL